MKRSALITVVTVLQTLLGLSLAGLTVYLVALSRSRETLAEPDAADTVRGLLIGALVLGVPAVITLIGAVGLWKNHFWGWVLTLATDVGMLAVFAYGSFGENDREVDEIAMAAGFGVLLVLLLLPSVRQFYWKKMRGTEVLRCAQNDKRGLGA